MSQFDWDYDEFISEWPENLFSANKNDLQGNYYGSMNKRIKTDNMVRDLSNDELCEMYFENSEDKEVINKIVTSHSFPAYDISVRCYENDRMSIKQKNGLQNVLITYLLKYKKEKKELKF